MSLQSNADCSSAAANSHPLLLPDVLFELVIHLDLYSLLQCQRVCRTWASVISRSREAQRTLFLQPDHIPFDAFKAVEERDIASRDPIAWQKPSQRIPERPEFRALFNPWIYTHDCEPITLAADNITWGRPATIWRFTDRVSAGRLGFCFTPSQLVSLADATQASWNGMFLTQPPVKRTLVSVQGGYLPKELFDVEKENGVRIGDIMSHVRGTQAVRVMRGRKGETDFTTLDLKFDEHFTGIRFLPLRHLVEDQFGNVDVKTI
ncbi:hypothetical protein C7974DRAFT_380344 [Boeremia exigua]|uniref:uncharacterized protein n=1 Tax=Boeremia exigua TaxID=749465 RepID=UPI001E8CBB3A|nr:uncharacterized protein C7974DRAFT_380344 [Boeremia exigua]KAH6613946.1 hypothetical protein C7974DRAFT_380344 [Boeremia exigua]